MTGAMLWDLLGRLDDDAIGLRVVAVPVNRPDMEGVAVVDTGEGRRLFVKCLDSAIVGVEP